jgi:hypothetical protein
VDEPHSPAAAAGLIMRAALPMLLLIGACAGDLDPGVLRCNESGDRGTTRSKCGVVPLFTWKIPLPKVPAAYHERAH